VVITDSAASDAPKRTTWANIKATLVATFLTFTNKIAIAATATTGAALSVVRNLTSTSTDSPVVDILQDHASDDQPALQVTQDGTGEIIKAVSNRNANVYILVSNSDTTNTVSRAVFRALSGTVDMRFQAITGFGSVIGSQTADPLYFVTNATARIYVDGTTGFVGIGVTVPQGILHIHDGTTGWLKVTKTAVVNVSQTIIPDGTGDVTKYVIGNFVIDNGGPIANAFSIQNGFNLDVVVGTGTWRFAVAANGAFTVIRQSGTGSATISLDIMWQ
jgi:hypothetical protein